MDLTPDQWQLVESRARQLADWIAEEETGSALLRHVMTAMLLTFDRMVRKHGLMVGLKPLPPDPLPDDGFDLTKVH